MIKNTDFVVLLLSLSLALLVGCATPSAQDSALSEGCARDGQIVSAQLNLRAEPGFDSAILATLQRGTFVELLDCTPEDVDQVPWVQVSTEFRGQPLTGWLSSKPRYLLLQ